MARAAVFLAVFIAGVALVSAKAGDGSCLYDPVGAPLANPLRLGEVAVCVGVDRLPIADQWCDFKAPPPPDPAHPEGPLPGEGTCKPCTVCAAGQYVKSACQAITPAIPFAGFTNTVCAACPANCATCAAVVGCTACKAGFTLTGAKTCVAAGPAPTPTPTPVPGGTRRAPPPPAVRG